MTLNYFRCVNPSLSLSLSLAVAFTGWGGGGGCLQCVGACGCVAFLWCLYFFSLAAAAAITTAATRGGVATMAAARAGSGWKGASRKREPYLTAAAPGTEGGGGEGRGRVECFALPPVDHHHFPSPILSLSLALTQKAGHRQLGHVQGVRVPGRQPAVVAAAAAATTAAVGARGRRLARGAGGGGHAWCGAGEGGHSKKKERREGGGGGDAGERGVIVFFWTGCTTVARFFVPRRRAHAIHARRPTHARAQREHREREPDHPTDRRKKKK